MSLQWIGNQIAGPREVDYQGEPHLPARKSSAGAITAATSFLRLACSKMVRRIPTLREAARSRPSSPRRAHYGPCSLPAGHVGLELHDVVQRQTLRPCAADQRQDVGVHTSAIHSGRRCLDLLAAGPSTAPLPACLRYHSHTAATVNLSWARLLVAAGSAPYRMSRNRSAAILRASSTVYGLPTLPVVCRFVCAPNPIFEHERRLDAARPHPQPEAFNLRVPLDNISPLPGPEGSRAHHRHRRRSAPIRCRQSRP